MPVGGEDSPTFLALKMLKDKMGNNDAPSLMQQARDLLIRASTKADPKTKVDLSNLLNALKDLIGGETDGLGREDRRSD